MARHNLIRIAISNAATESTLLEHLHSELVLIDQNPATTVETTLLVIAGMLTEFEAYNEFLAEVDSLLRTGGWEGKYQVASFDPWYRFHGTKDDDACNLTNRSPWPILHIIREASIDRALAGYSEPGAIPDRNIRTTRSLSPELRRIYFPWLSETPSHFGL